jgi:hypothetical protein
VSRVVCLPLPFRLQVVGGGKARPDILPGSHKGNGGKRIERNGVTKNDKDGGRRINPLRVDPDERKVPDGINNKAKRTPDEHKVDVLDNLNGRRPELRGFGLPIFLETGRMATDFMLFPGGIQAEDEHNERKLERERHHSAYHEKGSFNTMIPNNAFGVKHRPVRRKGGHALPAVSGESGQDADRANRKHDAGRIVNGLIRELTDNLDVGSGRVLASRPLLFVQVVFGLLVSHCPALLFGGAKGPRMAYCCGVA